LFLFFDIIIVASMTFGVSFAVCYCATSTMKKSALREFAWPAELVAVCWIV
jgi:hypothetical protein